MAQIPQNRQFQEAKVPPHWGAAERRYAQGVNDLLERLFYMFGRLSADDLGKPLRKQLTDTAGNLLEIQADVDQVKLTLTTVEGNVSNLTLSAQEFATRLSNAEGDISTIEQTAQELQTEVTNAKGDISGLQQTATGLQTQVNNLGNRNRTYLPSTVPPLAERVVGDLLIDTANLNVMNRWNGSAWVPVQDGAISIAQQQADKIQWLVASGTSAANMTLTSQLYSLMASNIDLSANDSINLAVSNIQVGGKNYVRDAGKGYTVLTYNTDVNPGGYSVDPQLVVDAKGKQIVVSFDFWYATWLQNSERRQVHIRCKKTDNTEIYLVASVPKGYSVANADNNTFQRWSQVIDFPVDVVSILDCYYYVNVLNYTIFKNLKIEVANKATAFSYHPDDPASGVKTSKVTIDGTGIAMTTGGTFTVGSQNFNIDAAGNVLMKGTVEAASGKIGGFTISGNKLVDTATGGTKAQFDPVTGTLILNDLEILQAADEITFRSRFASKLRYLDFSNPNGSIVFRTSNPTNSNWMTRFDVEMPTAAKPDGRTTNYGDSYIYGNCSAQSFTDRTPAYFGDALDELRWSSGSKAKGIDHSSLPKFAQKTIIGTRINEDGEKEDFQEEGRDLGAMVSVLTRAVQQLADKVDSQQRLIEDLNRRVSV